MANFNFADAAGRAYKFTWDERHRLMHYGLWPILLKICSVVLIVALELQQDVLRQGLVLMPAYFLEGWLVVIAMRFAVLGETAPEPLSGHDTSLVALARKQAMLAGIISYLLIKLMVSLFAGIGFMFAQMNVAQTKVDPSAINYFSAMVFLMTAIWGFRLSWLYVPVAVDFSAMRFLFLLRGFLSSFQMMALWVICMMPLALALLAFAKIMMVLLGDANTGIAGLIYTYGLAALQGVLESILAVICSVAMAYGLREMVSHK